MPDLCRGPQDAVPETFPELDPRLLVLPVEVATPALVAAVDEFYGQSKHSRDAEGWEDGALDSVYAAAWEVARAKRRRPAKRRAESAPRGASLRKRSKAPPVGGGMEEECVKLPESNIGLRMLRKIGWRGGGLGKDEKGRHAPVEAAPARPHSATRYRGVGLDPNDPIEAFRREKAASQKGRR